MHVYIRKGLRPFALVTFTVFVLHNLSCLMSECEKIRHEWVTLMGYSLESSPIVGVYCGMTVWKQLITREMATKVVPQKYLNKLLV